MFLQTHSSTKAGSVTPSGKRGRSAPADRERHESGKSDLGSVGPGTRASSRSERGGQPESPVVDLRRSKRNALATSG